VQKLLAPREAAIFWHQLSHLEAMDLPRKDQVGENTRRAPSRAGERDRPPVSEEAGARGHRDAAGKSAEDQRRNQLIGRVVAIKFSGLLAQVTLAIERAAYYSIITADAAKELR